MAQTEEIILDLKIDQGGALKDLEKTEKAILDLKQEQKELNKEYQNGTKTQDEYIKENIKLQNAIKKESEQKRTLNKLLETESNSRNAMKARVSQLAKEYDNLNRSTAEGAKRADVLEKELAQLNSQITKSSKSAGLFKDQIGNYPKSFGDAASSIRVAGVSVGDITTKLASFANPATAAIGLVGALTSVYARSTIGAKDLAFAQNQLASAITISSNAFAELISSSEDGEGIFSKVMGAIIGRISTLTAINSRIAADNIEKLEDLGRDEIEIRGRVSERLAENQELLTEIADEQVEVNKKAEDFQKIEQNLRQNQNELLVVLGRQLQIIKSSLAIDKNNDELLTQKLLKEREINKIIADTEKKIQANERAQSNFNQKTEEQLRIQAGVDRRASSVTRDVGAESINNVKLKETKDALTNAKIQGNDLLAIRKDIAEREKRLAKEVTDYQIQQEIKKNAAIQLSIQQAASIFEEGTAAYQILASADAGINTYKAANLALATFPPPFSYVAAATTIAAGLANVLRINGIEFAEGGYTGPGDKYKPAGIVHAGEVVWSQRDVAMAGGPIAVDSMRPTYPHRSFSSGYADGGVVTNAATAETNQALITANALKNQPVPEVSVVEINRMQKRVRVKENVTRF